MSYHTAQPPPRCKKVCAVELVLLGSLLRLELRTVACSVHALGVSVNICDVTIIYRSQLYIAQKQSPMSDSIDIFTWCLFLFGNFAFNRATNSDFLPVVGSTFVHGKTGGPSNSRCRFSTTFCPGCCAGWTAAWPLSSTPPL